MRQRGAAFADEGSLTDESARKRLVALIDELGSEALAIRSADPAL